MTKLEMKIDLRTVQAKMQTDESNSMTHTIPIDGLFHDLSYTGLDFNSLELNRERRFGFDVVHLDSHEPVAIILNNLNHVAIADYTQYANMQVVVCEDGSVILNSFLKQYNPIATVSQIIKGLNTSFNRYNKESLAKQLEQLDLSHLEDYINHCCESYSNIRGR